MPRLAVLGHPVGHSRSPAMHSAALAALGMGAEWSYEAIDVAPEEFVARVQALSGEGFAGANVTVPHKTAAYALADLASEGAARIGAANTLVFDGFQIGAHNTDAGGLVASLPVAPAGLRALVLGAGGAARAAIWALRTEGAVVDIWNRTEARAQQIHIELTDVANPSDSVQIELQVGQPVEQFDQSEYGLIVNTTAVGLRGEDPFVELPLRRDGFGPGTVVADMVYGEGPSTLLQAAAAAGAQTVDGIEILVQQGALSFEIWTGRKPPLDVMRAAAYSLGER
ncbi:MAG TPA: shikimate dehydrogenase [Solirubrobacterales bacterium]|nr:shikimate dehydrogenase [Solirubrobacterales bacterium]